MTLQFPDLSPSTLRAALEQALALIRAGQTEAAAVLCHALVRRFPDNGDAHHLLGLTALAAKRAAEAVPWISRAVTLDPGAARFHTNLGTAQQGSGAPGPAEHSYHRGLRLAPDQAETSFNLANLLVSSGRPEEAEGFYRRAVALQPERGRYWNNLGKLFLRLRREPEAIRAYAVAARAADGVSPDLFVNAGMAHQRLNQLPQALACYERALKDRADNPAAHWNRALALLVTGRLTEGWEEYEWRWRLSECPPRPFQQPLWAGEPLAGRTLLLHAEQGLGDTLQFIRYLPLVQALGGQLIVECQAPLRRLLADSFPEVTIIVAGEPLPDFDLHVPLLSLPRVFGTRIDNIPAAVPYLRVCSAGALPAKKPGTLAVGVVWGGDPAHRNDRYRSLDQRALAELLRVPDVTVYSLQKGTRVVELAQVDPTGRVINLDGQIDDFADSAALIQQLDVVVTVDTSVAHLAGALGRPVCIMLPYSPDWRWLLDRTDSPWYPSAALYRQTAPGDWSGVIRSVSAHLSTLRP